MKRWILYILLLLLVVAGIVAIIRISDAYMSESARVEAEDEPQEVNVPLGEPSFEWSYASFMEDEIPRTTVSLIARYSGGTVEEKKIDTIQGVQDGCNAYPEPDADVYPKSEMIICYYAGLGQYFKVVESRDTYVVQRKIFEEGTPDYSPEPEPFTTVAEFSK